MIADTAVITRETCDRCGPYVPAAYFVQTNNGPLAFCGHDTRYVIPESLAATAEAISGIEQESPVTESAPCLACGGTGDDGCGPCPVCTA